MKQSMEIENIQTLINNQFEIALENPENVCQATIDYTFQKITEAAIHAEEKCRKVRAGKQEWSPELKKAQAARTYWNLITQQKRGKHVCKRTLQHKRKLTPKNLYINPKNATQDEIAEMKRKANNNLRRTHTKKRRT